jgi:hypothetical protein
VTGQRLAGRTACEGLARRMKGTDCAGQNFPRQILSLIGRASGPCQLISIFPPAYLSISISLSPSPVIIMYVLGCQLPAYATSTTYLHIYSTEQCLASTKLLTTPPPSPPRGCVLQRRRGTHSPGGEGVGGQYFGRRQTLDWPLTV